MVISSAKTVEVDARGCLLSQPGDEIGMPRLDAASRGLTGLEGNFAVVVKEDDRAVMKLRYSRASARKHPAGRGPVLLSREDLDRDWDTAWDDERSPCPPLFRHAQWGGADRRRQGE